MSVPEYVRRKYSTMFTTHPPFAYEHTDDSILARLRCDMPSALPYKEQPIHSCAAERTRRSSLPATDRVAVIQALGIGARPFLPPTRSLTAPINVAHGDEHIASDWPDSPGELVPDHDDWTIVDPTEALTPITNKTGVNRCPSCKINAPKYLADGASRAEDQSQPSCACSDTKNQQQRRHFEYSEPVQVPRGAW